ncbi:MAG TPA: hypothetical protein CFH82_00530 [Sulfurospirillum sp. UBA12182]|jgi:hypothetical protein|nr:MAG TPA: hypothetical protein CFH82_00530 [Sulfurospirillum sp. UBA12182]
MRDTVFIKTLRDFFSKRFIFLSLAPFFIPLVILFGVFYYGGSEFWTLLLQGSQSGDFSFLDENAHPILAFLLGFSVVHWILITLLGVFGTIGVVLLSLVIAMVVVGFLTPSVVKIIREKHYVHVKPVKPDNLFKSLSSMGLIFVKFLALFLVCLPFLLLPFISFFILNIPFFYLFYKFMLYDILSCGISEQAHQIVHENSVYLVFVLLIFFSLSLIPLFGLLLQLFFVIYLTHFIFSKSV